MFLQTNLHLRGGLQTPETRRGDTYSCARPLSLLIIRVSEHIRVFEYFSFAGSSLLSFTAVIVSKVFIESFCSTNLIKPHPPLAVFFSLSHHLLPPSLLDRFLPLRP